MPFRLTSACRYVLVFKDNVVDWETVCGNSPQNWASPEDWCWDTCWPCHNSLVSTPRLSSPRHTCSPTTIGSRIPFLQDNQGMPVFCHRHDLSNLTHFSRKQSYIGFIPCLQVMDLCSSAKCTTDITMLHHVLFGFESYTCISISLKYFNMAKFDWVHVSN